MPPDTLIIGAGPVGLTMAAALTAQGLTDYLNGYLIAGGTSRRL